LNKTIESNCRCIKSFKGNTEELVIVGINVPSYRIGDPTMAPIVPRCPEHGDHAEANKFWKSQHYLIHKERNKPKMFKGLSEKEVIRLFFSISEIEVPIPNTKEDYIKLLGDRFENIETEEDVLRVLRILQEIVIGRTKKALKVSILKALKDDTTRNNSTGSGI
jgi:RNA recognition motif-containing protein